MKISGARLYRYNLPLAQALHLRQQMLVTRQGLIVCLDDGDGHEGWGEIAPLSGFSSESLDEGQAEALLVAARMTGITLPDPGSDYTLAEMLFSVIERPSVRFGFESAWVNLAADQAGVFPAQLFRREARSFISVNGLLSGTSDENLAQAAKFREERYPAVKLKVGRLPGHTEVKLVHQIRDAIGPEMSLRLDANRAWEYEEAMQFVESVADANIEYIEEPLAYNDALDQFATMSPVPIALDETLKGLSPESLGEYPNINAVVLKPTVLGGLLKCLTLAEHARKRSMKVVVSSAIESALGIYCCANLAAVSNDADIPAGLDTIRWFGENLLMEPLDARLPMIPLRLSDRLPRLIDKPKLIEVTGG